MQVQSALSKNTRSTQHSKGHPFALLLVLFAICATHSQSHGYIDPTADEVIGSGSPNESVAVNEGMEQPTTPYMLGELIETTTLQTEELLLMLQGASTPNDQDIASLLQIAFQVASRRDSAPPTQFTCDSYTGEEQTGIASYYGRRDGFAGKRTASGKRFNPNAWTAAHKELPFGTIVKVTNPGNGKSTVVKITDRGPYKPGRIIDLSVRAAKEIGSINSGIAKVIVQVCRPS